MSPNPLLAQAESSMPGTIVATVAVLLAVALLIGVVAVARKRFKNQDDDDGGGLSIGGLRDLVRQGKMTPEEYEAAKAQIVAAAQRKAEREALEVKPGGTAPRGGDGIDPFR